MERPIRRDRHYEGSLSDAVHCSPAAVEFLLVHETVWLLMRTQNYYYSTISMMFKLTYAVT